MCLEHCHYIKVKGCDEKILTQVNIIPSIKNCDVSTWIYTHEGINYMCAQIGINILNIKCAISRTVCCPALKIAHNPFCNRNSFSVMSVMNWYKVFSFKTWTDWQCTCNITLRGIPTIIFAVEGQLVIHILS